MSENIENVINKKSASNKADVSSAKITAQKARNEEKEIIKQIALLKANDPEAYKKALQEAKQANLSLAKYLFDSPILDAYKENKRRKPATKKETIENKSDVKSEERSEEIVSEQKDNETVDDLKSEEDEKSENIDNLKVAFQPEEIDAQEQINNETADIKLSEGNNENLEETEAESSEPFEKITVNDENSDM
ncbi:MAG: hypothetical protein IJS74_01120, partial [Clostridia bacterium]|nr:hypothetical protein [Clostridia bacterium]